MANGADSNGNFHDDDGRFVSLRDFVERIFSERESSAEFKRVALENALAEAKLTTKQQLVDAKAAVDERIEAVQGRLDELEAGGAPFASRLNQTLTDLAEDVEILNEDAVRTKVLDALREQDQKDRKQQARQIRLSLIGAAISLVIALVNIGIGFLSGG